MSKYLKDRDGNDTMYLSSLRSARATNTAFVYNRMQGALDRFLKAMLLVDSEKVNWSSLWKWVHESNYARYMVLDCYNPSYYEDEGYDRDESNQ